MKLYLNQIKLWFIYIFTFQFIDDYKMNQIAKKTTKIARQLERKRFNLKREINAYVAKTYGISFKRSSDFIPPKGVNKSKLRKDIMHKYSDRMLDVSLYLTPNLRWK